MEKLIVFTFIKFQVCRLKCQQCGMCLREPGLYGQSISICNVSQKSSFMAYLHSPTLTPVVSQTPKEVTTDVSWNHESDSDSVWCEHICIMQPSCNRNQS